MKLIAFDNSEIKTLLEGLKDDSKPLWGEMSADKMLQHLVDIARISSGKIRIDFANKIENLPKLRHILYKEVPFPKSFPAPAQVEDLLASTCAETDLDVLKQTLLLELEAMKKHYVSNDQTEVNAVFGPLNIEDWIWFHRKHISHHFAQFGLWSYA